MSKQSLEDLRARLEAVSKEYQKVQDGKRYASRKHYIFRIHRKRCTDTQAAVETHQRLDSQVNENEVVKKVSSST